MADRREGILSRLLEIAAALDGVKTAVRNQPDVSGGSRPAVIILDSDEAADSQEFDRGRPARSPNIVDMTPELVVLVGKASSEVGTTLNQLRAALVLGIMNDEQIASLTGSNGQVRYTGCTTQLQRGKTMEGEMSLMFTFRYPLIPDELGS